MSTNFAEEENLIYQSTNYRSNTPLEKRIQFRERSKARNPFSIAVIIERSPKEYRAPNLQMNRFVINLGVQVSEIIRSIILRLKKSDSFIERQLFYLMAGKKILKKNQKIQQVYSQYADKDDGLLYLQYECADAF